MNAKFSYRPKLVYLQREEFTPSRLSSLSSLYSSSPSLAAPTRKPTLNVGSKRFAESRILGEIITQTASKAGEAQAVHKSGLGNTGIVFAALQSGSIDIYPEYTGTISQELLKSKDKLSLARHERPAGPARPRRRGSAWL